MSITYFYISSQKELFNTQKELIFYKLYTISSTLLEEILKEYNLKKNNILKANDYVVNNKNKNIYYLKKHLGKNYHIFITDKNFVIKKTTFKYDHNFSLAFAKDIFLKHKKHPGISPPICEPATTEFFTFSDRYIDNRVIQIGYILNSQKIIALKQKIKHIIKQNPYIKDITLFFVHPKTKYAQECKILTPLHRKYTLKEMLFAREKGLKLYKKLLKQNPLFSSNAIYMLAKDPFSKESFIIYKITLNQSLINQKIDKIIIITLTSIFFIILFSSIVLLYIRKILSYLEEFTEHIKQEKQFKKTTYKELDETIKAYNKTLSNLQKALNSKEEFINFAMHEFATPINILSLYMNEYEEIKPAVKKLISSYKNLSFVIKDSNQKDTFNLKELILERIEYFKDIAMLENKTINYNLEDFIIQANREDIEILIDNNIKNAIKYSTSKEIFIHLKKNILQFENRGKIKNPKEIFEKFYREEKVKGGFGLGLYIIKEIAKSYNITINLKQLNDTIIFEYIFKGEDENSNS